MTINREQANELISQKIAEATALIKECEELAKEHKLSFSLRLGWRSNNYETCDPDEDYYLENPEEKPEDWEPDDFEPGWKNSSDYC
jgi:hypothetical protein